MLTHTDIGKLLRSPFDREWEVQGFGMLRTYMDREVRLQVWDQRLAIWGNGAVHDHPWDFVSTIVAGTLFNQRYVQPNPGLGTLALRGGIEPPAFPYKGVRIQPGMGGGAQGEPFDTRLIPQSVEVYAMGDTYSQNAEELHRTRYSQGTVTLLERHNRREIDEALSLWEENGVPWVFFEPRSATEHEIALVTRSALDTWWGWD